MLVFMGGGVKITPHIDVVGVALVVTGHFYTSYLTSTVYFADQTATELAVRTEFSGGV